jgi:hypothetical protein
MLAFEGSFRQSTLTRRKRRLCLHVAEAYGYVTLWSQRVKLIDEGFNYSTAVY